MRRAQRYLSVLFVMAVLGASGCTMAAASPLPARVQGENKPGDESPVRSFQGKILSQNGQRFILRDDVNEVWYNLDDQKQAGEFLGKNVVVTGVLDESTATIHVRSITEAKALQAVFAWENSCPKSEIRCVVSP